MLVVRRVSAATRLVCSRVLCVAVFTCYASLVGGDLSEAHRLEAAGDLSGARRALEADSSPDGIRAYAEFLSRHTADSDTASRSDLRKALDRWAAQASNPTARQSILQELAETDLLSGNAADLTEDLTRLRSSGGTADAKPGNTAPPAPTAAMLIPGPLPAFARMAALTPDVAPEELLPALARNVVTNGFEASGNESLQQTEYLRLLVRYLGQARELQAMAVKDHKIVVPACDSDETGAILKVLGYRMRGSCGGDIVLETVNPTRAFLTVDSGFPIAQLEAELRANHKFELPYAPTSIPVLYTTEYWMQAFGRNTSGDFIDAFLSDPSLCRLYLGLSHLDRVTADVLRKQAPPQRLKTYANVLDFYGGMFTVKNGVAAVPGSAKAWASLVGASPSNPGQFFERLMTTDDGWAASYYDALARLEGPTAAYLTDPQRLRRFYDALRGKVTSPGPARPVFRSSTELMLLTSALTIDHDGQAHVPGGIDSWRALFVKHPHGKYDAKLTRAAGSWRNNDDLLEALFALSRKTVENEPLRVFLALNDIDRRRNKPLSQPLVNRLIAGYRQIGMQYNVFADVPNMSEPTMGHYLDCVSDLSAIRDSLLRADAAGTFEASVELWRIFDIRGQISADNEDSSFGQLIAPFTHVRQPHEAFDAGRAAIDTLITAASGRAPYASRQDQMIELLVGRLPGPNPPSPAPPSDLFLKIYDAQRLVPVDTLFGLASAKATPDGKLLKSLRSELDREGEADTARGALSADEKNALTSGYWSSRHIEQERRFDIDKALKNAGGRKDLHDALAPFLRDSLLGFVYAYYAPPGAQLLLTNPIFVRTHDFLGAENNPMLWRNTEVSGTGWPASAGGKLSGSLSTVAYALAEAEQNFLTPRREQALIWADLAPQMIVDVTVTRWAAVKPEQLQWTAAHLRRGRNLLAASALDSGVEAHVLDSYARYTTPAQVDWLRVHLVPKQAAQAIATVPPSVLYALADDRSLRGVAPDLAVEEIAQLEQRKLPALDPAAIGRVFGSPKPTLTHSYVPGLLHLRTFPALMGYSSRILAETWESNALYYAALADELAIPANRLDAYVPEWNRSTIENIFATHLEDWPAILRSLHTTGEHERARARGDLASAGSGKEPAIN